MAKTARRNGMTRPGFRPLTIAGSTGPARRSCGGCVACCTPYVIAELDKPAYVPCRHITPLPNGGAGCGCYETRPAPCRRFECLWLKDLLPEEMRPDKVGYVCATNWTGAFVQVDELVPGATDACPRFHAWADEVRLSGIEVHIVRAPEAAGETRQTR